jgi:two-component system cell cycle sensor histidine kinase/response regulator CckA
MDAAQASSIAAIADALPVGIWVARVPGGEFVYANRAFAEIMGMTARDDVKAGGYTEPYGIFTRDGKPYREERLPFVRAMRERTVVVVDDLSIHRRDGRKVAVRAMGKPLFDEKGEMTSVAIAFFDVTAEVDAVRERTAVQDRLSRVVNAAPLILWAADQRGLITLSEGRGLASMGLKPGQLVGRSIQELYAGEPEVLANFRRALSGEEFSTKDKVGERSFETSFSPLRDAAGAVTGHIGVTMNVTESEQLQAKLVESERMASLGMLAASVAHEVNTPLTYVAASLDHLRRELPKLAGGAELLALVDEARLGTERVKTIAKDLSHFSRPHERLEPLDVRDVLESALRMTANETLRRARVVQEWREVPPVIANDARLAQVFLNLLLNAAQAIPEGDPEKNEIRVSVALEGERVVVEVTDSGAGIPAEILPRIFDPFFTTKPVGHGSGLGLAICRNIARAFGGDVTADSRPGRTAFRLALPRAERRAGEASAQPGISGRPRVLVVDDDASLRRVLSRTLDDACELEIADSGQRALELMLGDRRYDVILCDLMMPDMTGMDVFERVRRERPGLERSLCFMTGGAFTRGAREFLQNVPNRCFEKPFDFSTVIAQVLREGA